MANRPNPALCQELKELFPLPVVYSITIWCFTILLISIDLLISTKTFLLSSMNHNKYSLHNLFFFWFDMLDVFHMNVYFFILGSHQQLKSLYIPNMADIAGDGGDTGRHRLVGWVNKTFLSSSHHWAVNFNGMFLNYYTFTIINCYNLGNCYNCIYNVIFSRLAKPSSTLGYSICLHNNVYRFKYSQLHYI